MSEKELKLLIQKVLSELKPFVDRVRTREADVQLFKQAYLDHMKMTRRSSIIAEFITREREEPTKRPSVRDVIYEIFCYLGLVESLGNSCVNIITMLLIANSRDFHIERMYGTPRIKHVVSLRDLEEERVPLTIKLNFLTQKGIRHFTEVIDTELRNAIAHLRFDVKEDKILWKGKQMHEVVITNSRKLLVVVLTVWTLLRELAEDMSYIPQRESSLS